MYSIYHLAKADFLERIRSFSFLVVLGACMYLTYTFVPGPKDDYFTVTLGNYRGLYNAAWIGTLVAMMSSVFLTLFGFYLVNSSVSRDYTTGVGQIIATTQVNKMQYLLGKTLSNFMVFLSVTTAVAVMATVMLYLKKEEAGFNLWNLYSPFLWITLPAMFFVAALAVFFECFRKVSRGFINIAYFFLFMIILGNSQSQPDSSLREGLSDLFGVDTTFHLMGAELQKEVNDYNEGYSIGYIQKDGPRELKTFSFKGVSPGPYYLMLRLWWVLISFLLLLAGAFFFRRFDPTYDPELKQRKKFSLFKAAEGPIATVPFPRLTRPLFSLSFPRLVKAEWKLMIAGTGRWWWLVNLGLFITVIFVQLETAHGKVLLLLWAWQILLWSSLGSREKQFNTGQVIFSSPNVLTRQLLAGLTATISWALILASPVILRLTMAGETEAVTAIVTSAIFLPVLALFCGIYTGGGKLFQVLYLLMAYSVLQNMPYFDYLGAVDGSKEFHLVPIFLILIPVMLFFSFLGRRKEISV